MLGDLDARYRGHHEQVLRPTAEILRGTGHSLLMTRLGPLDVLGAIEGGRDYDVLVPDSIEIEVAGNAIRVLRLEKIVEIKRASKHPKDQRMLPLLEETLKRR